MFELKMMYYVSTNKDGTIHVQNCIMGRFGQHHVHSKKGFENWKKNISEKDIIKLKDTKDCNCNLKVGDVKEYDGTIWHNEKFE